MMLSRELTDSEWAEGIPWRRTTVEIHGMRASITTRRRRRRRRSDCLPPSSIPVNPLARTTTTRSHRLRYTEARLCLKSERTDALQLTTCILVKVSLRFTVDFVYFVANRANYSFPFSRRWKQLCALAILLILTRVKVCNVIYFRVSSIFAATSDNIRLCDTVCDLHKSLTSW